MMKSEEVASERIESLLREAGLLEARPKVGNILKKKNAAFERKTSKEAYLTVNSEISSMLNGLKKSIDLRCSRYKDVAAKKRCKAGLKKQLYSNISGLAGQCKNSKYHEKRCLRRIQTILDFLKKEFDS